MTLQQLQKLDNNSLFNLVLKTGVKKVHSFPADWKEFERNCIIERLDRHYQETPEKPIDIIEKPVSLDLKSLVDCLKEKSPNNPLLLKNVNNWTLKDLERAKTFL